jgi:hypothetical protein
MRAGCDDDADGRHQHEFGHQCSGHFVSSVVLDTGTTVCRLGGPIVVTSKPGIGSRFQLVLPLCRLNSTPTQNPRRACSQSRPLVGRGCTVIAPPFGPADVQLIVLTPSDGPMARRHTRSPIHTQDPHVGRWARKAPAPRACMSVLCRDCRLRAASPHHPHGPPASSRRGNRKVSSRLSPWRLLSQLREPGD